MALYTNSRPNEELRKLVQKAETAAHKGFGLKGHTYIDSGRAQPAGETYYLFEVLTAGQVTYHNAADNKTTTDEPLAVGDRVYGIFTSLEEGTDATAVLRAYKF